MSERLNVLFLPPRDQELWTPWVDEVVAAISPGHNLTMLDYNQPLAPQFKNQEMVIDFGGSMGTREMVDVAHDTRLWQVLGTGVDHFDLDYWRSKNMPVTNCPGPFSAVALAECAVMFMLLLTRRYNEAVANLAVGRMYKPTGYEMVGKQLGIIGFGASGIELARRAKGFGLRMLAIDIRDISDAEKDEYRLEFTGKPDAMDKVIAESDFLSLHLHLNKSTRHIMDARRLGLMKPTAYLINVARGALVDEAALMQALRDGIIAGAGIDVFAQEPPDMSSPLGKMPNVITTPHIAGMTDGTAHKRAQCAATNANRVAAGLEPLYRVD